MIDLVEEISLKVRMSIAVLVFCRYAFTEKQTYMYQAKTPTYFLAPNRALGSNCRNVLRKN